MNAKRKVLIVVPSLGWIHAQVALRVSSLVRDVRFDVTFMPWIGMPVDDTMNRATRHFLDSTDCDYMLRMDADQSPIKNPLDLIELGLNVVGGAAHRWDGKLPVKFNSKHRDDAPFRGLQRVQVASGGCLLIERSVFERIGTGWWTHIYNECGYMSHGDDVAFCKRCAEHGIHVHVHYDYVCHHFKMVDMLSLAAP